MKHIIIAMIVLIFHNSTLYGDSLKLKNGRNIDCDKIWEEDGQIKCRRSGHINVGYPKENVEEIIIKKSEDNSQSRQSKKWSGSQDLTNQKSQLINISINPNNFLPADMALGATGVPFTTSLTEMKPAEIAIEPKYNGEKQLYGILTNPAKIPFHLILALRNFLNFIV